MKVLSVESYGLFVGKKGDRFIVSRKGNKLLEVPAGNVSLIRLSSRGVSASMDVIKLALKYNIPVIIVGKNGRPIGVFYPFEYKGIVELRKKQYIAQDGERAADIARMLVIAKISNQMRLLRYVLRNWRKLDSLVVAKISGAIEELKGFIVKASASVYSSVDVAREKSMSFEALAAQAYWKAFSYLIPEEYGFEGRVKRGACDVVNMLLNYGYAILSGICWLAIFRVGLDPWAGFLHLNSQRRPGLVYDLMEPFRAPIVDYVVLDLVRRGIRFGVNEECMLDGDSRRRLSESLHERFRNIVSVSGRRITFEDAVLLQARWVADYIAGRRGRFKVFLW